MQLVKGISDGCKEAECSLVGGETAILPDFYQPGDFDMAGFCAGVVERDRIIDGRHIQAGDAVIGLASSGLHSNGYSLVRKIVFEAAGLKVTRPRPGTGQDGRRGAADADAASTSSRCGRWCEHYPVKKRVIRGLANITGGGLPDNVARILPPGKRVVRAARVVAGAAGVRLAAEARQRRRQPEMVRVFNMGVGFVVIVQPALRRQHRQAVRGAGRRRRG